LDARDALRRTLVVSSYTPALGSGHALRTYATVRALVAHGPVELLYKRFGADEPDPAYRALDGVSLRPVEAGRGPVRAVAVLRAQLGGVPPRIARGISPELRAAAQRAAAGAERVIAEDLVAAAALLGLAGRRPVIYSANNLESAFRDLGSMRRLRAFERRLLEAMAETWMPSRVEIEAAAELAPGAALRYVPNVVDVAAIEPRRAVADPPEVLFVADFTYAPNREGLRLLGKVLPRVWEAVPDLRLVVAGRGAQAPRDADPRVSIVGFVDDLAPLYARAACAVVPLVTGGGSPLKFVEALAYGVPVVSTPRGAGGLEVQAGREYLEGEGPDGLAEAIVAALDSERGETLGTAGRAFAEREHSIESLVERLAG
jgi:glycosyltransferase involved in cell wall biosynthesis